MAKTTLILRGVALIVSIGLLALPYLAPVLAAFIDPVHGLAGAAMASGLPEGVFEAPGIPGKAVVVWDEHGIPHIYATTDEAGVYALGWVSASMRLFQMDLLRRVGKGTLAELIGPAGLDNDKFARSLGLNHVAEETWKEIREKPELQKLEDLLLAYSRGVNDYIRYAEEHNLLPLEYRVLRAKPEPWDPTDTIAISRVIALALAWNDEDLVLAKLVDRWGPEIVDVMGIPSWPDTLPQARCSEATTWGEASGASDAYSMLHATPTTETLQASKPPSFDAIHDWITRVVGVVRAYAGMASNNWVVAPAYSASGKPIVANDPHLQLSAPPIWLAAELNTPSFKSIGTLFPGTPLIVIGRNQHVAWAFTNVMGDFTDYYYYVWDGDRYYYKGQWLEAEKRVETITVRDPTTGRVTMVNLTVLETVHGPVLERDGERLAVAWTGLYPSFELQFFVELNNASSVRDALAAQRWFLVPIQNFVVADDQGNIAYSPVGGYPVRTNLPVILENPRYQEGPILNIGMLPFNGSRGEGEWAGLYPKEEEPILYNPPEPFIVTANSKPWDGQCGPIVGWHYGDKYRQERITQLLGEAIASKGKLTAEDMERIQLDYLDLSIKEYLETAILPYDDSNWSQLLREWLKEKGPLMDKDSYEPTIAMAWVLVYHETLWRHLYNSTSDIGFLRIAYALNIVRAAASGDEYVLSLIPRGSLEEAADLARREALARLLSYYGTKNYHEWRYGDIHYYLPKHPAFDVLDYERVPANGGPYTVNPARPAYFDPAQGMPVHHGASMRHIVDLSTQAYLLALPGGENGNPFSPHYQDIYLEYWAVGRYIEYTLSAPPEAYGGPRLEFQGVSG